MVRRLMRPGLCLAVAGFFVAVLPAYDVNPEAKPLVALFEARYRAAHTLRATFLERYTENGHIVRVEAGTAYFRRPGKMRWEYESPEKNLFLVDGKTAWFYVPADHTATRVPAKMSTDWRTPLALLAGEMKVARVCDRVQAAIGEKLESLDNAMLSCGLRVAAPKPATPDATKTGGSTAEHGETVLFEIVKKTGDLVGVVVRDPGGVGIEFHFANWQQDPQVAESMFRFNAPPGVAIVNGELPDGGGAVNP
jgi:outer membrane lipoprotein carrier protein